MQTEGRKYNRWLKLKCNFFSALLTKAFSSSFVWQLFIHWKKLILKRTGEPTLDRIDSYHNRLRCVIWFLVKNYTFWELFSFTHDLSLPTNSRKRLPKKQLMHFWLKKISVQVWFWFRSLNFVFFSPLCSLNKMEIWNLFNKVHMKNMYIKETILVYLIIH